MSLLLFLPSSHPMASPDNHSFMKPSAPPSHHKSLPWVGSPPTPLACVHTGAHDPKHTHSPSDEFGIANLQRALQATCQSHCVSPDCVPSLSSTKQFQTPAFLLESSSFHLPSQLRTSLPPLLRTRRHPEDATPCTSCFPSRYEGKTCPEVNPPHRHCVPPFPITQGHCPRNPPLFFCILNFPSVFHPIFTLYLPPAGSHCSTSF